MMPAALTRQTRAYTPRRMARSRWAAESSHPLEITPTEPSNPRKTPQEAAATPADVVTKSRKFYPMIVAE